MSQRVYRDALLVGARSIGFLGLLGWTVAACGSAASAPVLRPVVAASDPADDAPPTPPSVVRRLVTGQGTSCVLVSGKVFCWGLIVGGATPRELTTLRGATSISGLGAVVCGLVRDGMRCAVGPKDYFQVDLPDRPIDLAVRVGVGCAALRNGEVYCWDENEFEESIADMTAALTDAFDESENEGIYTETYLVTKKIAGIQSARELAADETTVCARGDKGAVCFSHRVPEPQLRPVAGVRDLAPGSLALGAGRAFALRPDGKVVTWRTTEATLRVEPADTLAGSKKVALGRGGLCSIGADGKPSCRTLGGADDDLPDLVASSEVGALGTVDDLSVGERHACALRGDAVSCWGAGDLGELGVNVGVLAVPNVRATRLVSFAFGTCAFTASEPWCWGKLGGRAAAGGFEAAVKPRPTSLPAGQVFETSSAGFCALAPDASVRCGATRIRAARAVAERNDVACVVLGDGRVVCWRHGRFGSEAVATDREPAVVEGIADAAGVAIGKDVACAWDRAGGVACWGSEAGKRRASAPVMGMKDIVEVAIRNREVCGRTRAGHVQCARWPTGAIEDLGVTDVAQLVAGSASLCVRLTSGEVRCRQGERGHLTPVAGVTGAVELVSGAGHACVRKGDGGVACWGQWEHGQLGSQPPWVRSAPISVTLPGR